MTDDSDGSSMTERKSKVERLIDEYDLDEIGTELEARWTREENPTSTRQLADYFNRELLETALFRAGIEPLESEVETIYRVIKGETENVGEEVQVRERLAEHEIDPAVLADDFISHQTMYNYLTNIRDAVYERESDPEERLANANTNVQKMKSKLTAVAEGNVKSLSQSGLVTVGEFDVVSEVYVYCYDCESRHTIRELIERRGCDCREASG